MYGCAGSAFPASIVLIHGQACEEEESMLYYALVFLILGLVASALGAYGVAAVASQIAWVLFVIGIVLLIVHLVSGRRTLVP
jgi:uncharacterized membrane protein YtjA (UPF0391 family)